MKKEADLEDVRERLNARLEAKDKEIERLREALLTFRNYGCPVCGGDCASANPPVPCCPMQMAEAALAR